MRPRGNQTIRPLQGTELACLPEINVCIEVNPNRGISLPFICGQGKEAPGGFSKSQAGLAPAMRRLQVGGLGGSAHQEAFGTRPSIRRVLALGNFSSSQDIVFPACFHKYVKNAAQEREMLKYLSCI